MWKFQRNYANHRASSAKSLVRGEGVVMMVREERQNLPCGHYWCHALYSRLTNAQWGLWLPKHRAGLLRALKPPPQPPGRRRCPQSRIVQRHSHSGNWREQKRMFYFLPISQELLYFYQLWNKKYTWRNQQIRWFRGMERQPGRHTEQWESPKVKREKGKQKRCGQQWWIRAGISWKSSFVISI